jgi:hypothetical protein
MDWSGLSSRLVRLARRDAADAWKCPDQINAGTGSALATALDRVI